MKAVIRKTEQIGHKLESDYQDLIDKFKEF